MQPTPTLPPTYTAILQQIGQQFQARKGSILKRTLLIIWPYILLFVVIWLLKNVGYEVIPTEIRGPLVIAAIVYIVLALIYSIIVGFIFQIEKQIWIDSFFDNHPLELSQSWKIAKKVFWPAMQLRLFLIARYYLLPIIIYFVIVLAVVKFALLALPGAGEMATNIFAVVCLASLVILGVYLYFVKIKLRYTWFIFLDHYGSSYSLAGLIDEMDKLNKASKSDSFKKSLVANLGTDVVNAIAQSAIGIIGAGVGQLGSVGQVVGGVFQMYGKEVARQVTDYANITAQYILYRFARKEIYGEEQKVNSELYNL